MYIVLTPNRFAPTNLSPQPGIPGYSNVIGKLLEDDEARFSFLKACLEKLGLEVCQDNMALPPLSNIHLSAADNTKVSELLFSWADVIDKESDEELLKGEADTFRIQSDDDDLAIDDLQQALPPADEHPTNEAGIVDYSAITKTIIAHEKALPSIAATPRFNHQQYFSSLKRYQATENGTLDWGNTLMYGDVVTSTNSLLEK